MTVLRIVKQVVITGVLLGVDFLVIWFVAIAVLEDAQGALADVVKLVAGGVKLIVERLVKMIA